MFWFRCRCLSHLFKAEVRSVRNILWRVVHHRIVIVVRKSDANIRKENATYLKTEFSEIGSPMRFDKLRCLRSTIFIAVGRCRDTP